MIRGIARNADFVGIGAGLAGSGVGTAMILGGLALNASVASIAVASLGGVILMVGVVGCFMLVAQKDTLLKMVKEREVQAKVRKEKEHHLQGTE